MKLFFKSKDGGKDSNVTGYWLIEAKSLFSIVLLRFDRGSREAFHNHAFNAVSWVIRGRIAEVIKDKAFHTATVFYPSLKPIYTSRDRMHQVVGITPSTWVLSFRSPWSKSWKEYLPEEDKEIILTNGRVVIND